MFSVSDIPYAGLYLPRPPVHTLSLSQYVNSFSSSTNQSNPMYIFDGTILQTNPVLARDCPTSTLFQNSHYSVAFQQFTIGPRYSGSPPHFHSHAFNGLVYGVKQWYLWPPAQAFFSFKQVNKWVQQDLQQVYLYTLYSMAKLQ